MSDDIKKTDEELEKATDIAPEETDVQEEKAAPEKKKTAKADKSSKAKKSAKVNIFKRFGKGFVRFCKDFKGETKKIIWPGRQMVIKSTGVVLSTIIIVGAGIWIVDYALSGALDLIKTGADKLDETTTTVAASDTTGTAETGDTTVAVSDGDTTVSVTTDTAETTAVTTAATTNA